MNQNIVLLSCGDKRMEYVAPELEQAGYQVKKGPVPSVQDILEADYCILPTPVSRNGTEILWNDKKETLSMEQLCANLKSGQRIYGGVIPERIRKVCEQRGALFFDFMEMEDVAKENAIATAEGTIAEAITLGECNLHQSNCLVIGYGKCGKALAEKLLSLKAKVTVMARRESVRKEIEETIGKAVDMGAFSKEYDYVFNTVPAPVLTKEGIDRLSYHVVIIDIASKPGGVDFEYCEQTKRIAKLSLGIPGRYSPKTSGEILARAFLEKEGERKKEEIQ